MHAGLSRGVFQNITQRTGSSVYPALFTLWCVRFEGSKLPIWFSHSKSGWTLVFSRLQLVQRILLSDIKRGMQRSLFCIGEKTCSNRAQSAHKTCGTQEVEAKTSHIGT